MTEAEVKESVRRRDGHRCVACGMTADEHRKRFGRTLSVHRLTPGAEYRADDCRTLCRPCHEDAHRVLIASGAEVRRKPGRVARPPSRLITVYLDKETRSLLGRIAAHYGLSRAGAVRFAVASIARRLEEPHAQALR